MRVENITLGDGGFTDLFADENKELWNGEVAASRVSIPLGLDYSMWIERDIVIEIPQTDIDISNNDYNNNINNNL